MESEILMQADRLAQMAVIIGVVVGSSMRAIVPYMMRYLKTKEPFDWMYVRSTIAGCALGLFGAGLALPMVAGMEWQAALWLGISTGYALPSAIRHAETGVKK